MEGLKLR